MSNKKLYGLVIGLLAVAFTALPSIASAHELTTSAGKTVAVGTTVSATSTNAQTVLTGVGTLKCAHVEIHGIVTVNNGSEVDISMDGESDTATGCEINGTPVAVKPTLETILLNASGTTAQFSFTASGGLVEKSTSKVTYTGPKATKIHVEGPVTGATTGTFSGDFTLLGGLTLD